MGYLLSKSLFWCRLLILHSQLSQALWWPLTLISFLQFVRAEFCAARHHSSVSNLMPIFWTPYNQVKIIGCIWFNFTCTLIPYISWRGKLATVVGSRGTPEFKLRSLCFRWLILISWLALMWIPFFSYFIL